MGKKVRKIIRYVIAGIFLLILLLIIIGFLRLPVYLKNHLSNWIATESENLYKLSFNEISLKMNGSSFSITGVELTPDPEIAREVNRIKPGKVFYSFKSPEIQVNNISFLDFIRQRSLSFDQLKVVKPRLDLSGSNLLHADSAASFQYLFRELQPVLRNKLSQIRIKEILLEDAEYELYRFLGDSSRISNAEKISVAIREFRTDSTLAANPKMPFESEDIEIRINNFRTIMGDSLHFTSIGTLVYSFRKSEIRASDFHLYPRHLVRKTACYDVFVPEFHLKSKSIRNFKVNDSLIVDSLEFINPEIKYYQKKNPRKIQIEDINNFDLFNLVRNQFRLVSIHDFYLSGAQIYFFKQPDTTNYQQHFNRMNIHLINFDLDSLSGKNTERLFHAKELEMNLSKYHLRLDDKIHEFRADSIYVSTLKNRLGANKIAIVPLRHPGNLAAEIRINCDEVSFNNTDLKKLYHKRLFTSALTSVIGPKVKITYPAGYLKKEGKGSPGILFNMVSAYLRGVYSDNVRISAGSLNIINQNGTEVTGYFETGFDFRLTDFKLDSLSINNPERFFFAKGYELKFNRVGMKLVDNLHQLNSSLVVVSSDGNSATIDSLRLKPVTQDISNETMMKFNRSEAFNIFVPQIKLQGTNLHEAWFNNRLFIDRFTVFDPDFSYESFGPLKKKKMNLEEFYKLVLNYLADIEVKRLEIPSGRLKIVSHSKKEKTIAFNNSFSASLDNFRFNEVEIARDKLLFSDNFDLTLNEQLFGLSDSVHFLKAGSIRFSTLKSTINIENALLYPDENSKRYPMMNTTFRVSLPDAELKGVDLKQVLRKKEVEVKTLNLKAPELSVFTLKKKNGSKSMKDFSIPMPASLNWLKIGKLNLNDGKVLTWSSGSGKPDTTSSFGLILNADDIFYNKGSELTTRDFTTKITGLKIKMSEKGYHFGFKELNYNKSGKKLTLSDFDLSPSNEANTSNRIKLRIPLVELSGFDAQEAVGTDDYIFDKIRFSQPEIYLTQKKEKKKDDGINEAIKPFANSIRANMLVLENSAVNVTGNKKPFELKHFNLTLKDISIGKEEKTDRFLNSHDYEFTLGHIERKSKDGLYRFTADSINYRSVEKQLLVKSVKINPTLDRQKYEDLKGFQSDYMNGMISIITINHPDLNEWLDNNTLKASSLRIGNSSFTFFRNKRLPFNLNQHPMMPVQLINTIETPFRIDSVFIEPATVSYSELTETTDKHGTITFNDLTGKSGLITNIQPLPKEINLIAEGKLMNVSKIKAEFRFETSPPEYRHTVKGSLEPMALNKLNGMLENTSLLSVETGELQRLDVDLTNTDKTSAAKIWFGFNDLKVSVLRPESMGFKKAKLPTFLANNFMLPSRNPKNKELEPVIVNYERDEKRSFLNFWWKAIFTGIKDVLGFKDKEKKK